MLEELDSSLNAQGIALVFAEMKDPVRQKIERYGLARKIEARHFFPTIGAAVAAFRDETGAQWTAPSSPPPDRTAPGQIAADTGPPPTGKPLIMRGGPFRPEHGAQDGLWLYRTTRPMSTGP